MSKQFELRYTRSLVRVSPTGNKYLEQVHGESLFHVESLAQARKRAQELLAPMRVHCGDVWHLASIESLEERVRSGPQLRELPRWGEIAAYER